MNKKEYLILFSITAILVILSATCLYVVTTLDDVSETYETTAEHSKSIINRIKSGEQPLTDKQVIKLFRNEIDESNSIQSLLNSYGEMMEAFAYLIIILALFQGYIIVKNYFKP